MTAASNSRPQAVGVGHTSVGKAEASDAPSITAFVFQGGGSLTAPQVGTLRALTAAGIKPHLVIGTSAGALNATAFATDPTPLGVARLEDLWLRLRRRDVAGLSPKTFLSGLLGRGDGLFDMDPLERLLRDGLVAQHLEDTPISTHVVATDVLTGIPIVMSAGDTASALLASAAFPGIYAPVTREGRRLFDGGVAADIPILQAESLGATVSYILPAAGPNESGTALRGPLALTYHALGQILESATRRDRIAAQGIVHALPAAVSNATNPLDFRDTARLIRDGYDHTRRWLESAAYTASPLQTSLQPVGGAKAHEPPEHSGHDPLACAERIGRCGRCAADPVERLRGMSASNRRGLTTRRESTLRRAT